MMVMTAKVDFKKILLILAGAAAVLLAVILLLGGGQAEAAAAPSAASNGGRVEFLRSFGWDLSAAPWESGQVRIPKESSEVFSRYNLLQKAQGYDLTGYAGKNVMRYVYEIRNYPGASAPVYATLLVYGDQVIGGDITDTSPGGRIRGFQMPRDAGSAPTETAEPSQTQPSGTLGSV